jgi:hypothetical protein
MSVFHRERSSTRNPPQPQPPQAQDSPTETHVEESMRLSEQAGKLAGRDPRPTLPPAAPSVPLHADGLPCNPVAPPEKPARAYSPGHDPLCVYRHNQGCRCIDYEKLP